MRTYNILIHASSTGGHFRVLIFGSKKKGNLVASARLLQRSTATRRAVVALVKPADSRRKKPEEGDRKEGTTMQQMDAGDSDRRGVNKAGRRPKVGGNEAAEVYSWPQQRRGRRGMQATKRRGRRGRQVMPTVEG